MHFMSIYVYSRTLYFPSTLFNLILIQANTLGPYTSNRPWNLLMTDGVRMSSITYSPFSP